MKKPLYNVAIIGAGPAGLTAGIYTARSGLEPCIIEGKSPGGQLMSTTLVENWPGSPSIVGPQLMMTMKKQTKDTGCFFYEGSVTNLEVNQRPFTLTIDNETTIYAHTIIIATGATPKRLGCPGENEYWGKGVTPCAVCDGALYKDMPVIIVGGGDTAMESASFLAKITNKITILQLNSTLTASAAMQARVLNNSAISIRYNTTVKEIKGNGDHVTHVITYNTVTNQEEELKTNGVFLAVGLQPNTALFKGKLDLDKNGYLVLSDKTKTSVPGIFGAGDVADYRYRQAITAAGDGCMAAMDVERFLSENM